MANKRIAENLRAEWQTMARTIRMQSLRGASVNCLGGVEMAKKAEEGGEGRGEARARRKALRSQCSRLNTLGARRQHAAERSCVGETRILLPAISRCRCFVPSHRDLYDKPAVSRAQIIKQRYASCFIFLQRLRVVHKFQRTFRARNERANAKNCSVFELDIAKMDGREWFRVNLFYESCGGKCECWTFFEDCIEL